MFASSLTAIAVLLPLCAVFYLALFPEENIWPHLLHTVLGDYIRNTLALMIGVGICSILLGVGSAWLIANCEFPGRKHFSWLLLLPFSVPAYVIAYTYTDLLEYAGPVQSALRQWFDWQKPADYWFPEIRSLEGAVVMMSLVLYPYIFMLAKASFLEQSPSLFTASRSLGKQPWQTFFRVSLPIARPAIMAGLALVLMETLNDFGTVDFFAVRTLTAGLYDTWLNLGNVGGAAQIAAIMLVFVVGLIWTERYSRRKIKLYQNRASAHGKKRIQLEGPRAILAFLACLILVLTGFAIPFGTLTWYAIRYFEVSWNNQFFSYALNSLLLASAAALMTIVAGILLNYTHRLFQSTYSQFLAKAASLGYAMPGAVLAVGIIIPLAALDNTLDEFSRHWFNQPIGLLFSGSVFALIMAYSIRFLAVASGGIESSLEKVTPNMDMASRSLGLNTLNTLIRVHLPIISKGVLTAALVVFVDAMKELPATLILRPFNFETLATHLYQLASDELLEESALSALLIVVAGLLPVILLNRTIDKN